MFPLQFRGGALKLFLPMKTYFAANPPEMMLFTNPHTCAYLDTTAEYIEASFAGYARQAVAWQSINYDLVYTFGIQSEDIFFDNTDISAVTVYGWLLIDPAEPTVPLIGFNFPGSGQVINAGNRLGMQIIWGTDPNP